MALSLVLCCKQDTGTLKHRQTIINFYTVYMYISHNITMIYYSSKVSYVFERSVLCSAWLHLFDFLKSEILLQFKRTVFYFNIFYYFISVMLKLNFQQPLR